MRAPAAIARDFAALRPELPTELEVENGCQNSQNRLGRPENKRLFGGDLGMSVTSIHPSVDHGVKPGAEGFAGGVCTRTADALVAPVTKSKASEATGHTRLSQGAARFSRFSCGRMPLKENWFPLCGDISQ